MRSLSSSRKHVVLLLGAALACLVPTPWVAFPAALLLVLWLPGHLLLTSLRELDGLPGRAWLAGAASFALLPVPLSWLWRFSNDRIAVLAAVLALNVLLLLLLSRRGPPETTVATMFPSRSRRRWFGLLVGYVGVCVFGSYWLPGAGDRVATRAAHDYVKHHAVLLSLELHTLPLHNAFYAAEADTPYYYYEYHYYVPAALRKLTNDRVSIGFAFGFTSAVLAAVFLALVYLVAERVLGSARGAFFAAVCVSIVGGWDALPILIRTLGGAGGVIILDSWCAVPWRAHNLMTQFFWCPQHIAAVVALLLAGLALRQAPSARWWIIAAPLLAASVFGSSVYLAMTFFLAAAVFVLVWLNNLRADPPRFRSVLLALVPIALLGVLLMGLQAWGYQEMSRRFPGGLTLEWDRFPLALLGRLLPPGPFANLLDAPWILLIDLGLPAVACLLVARRFWSTLWRDAATRLLLIAGVLGTLALYTFRSDINPFDYSFRVAVKPAQVIAAICAGALLTNGLLRQSARRWLRPVLVVGVLLGLPVGFYEAPLMAVRSFLLTEPHRLDAGAIRFLRHEIPRDAIVQGDPTVRLNLVQLIDRQMGVLDPDNSHVRVFFPRDEQRMRRTFDDVERAFDTASGSEAYRLLASARVTHVLAGSLERERFGQLKQFDDAAWFELLYQDEHARVYGLRPDRTPAPFASQAHTRDTAGQSP